MNQALLGVLSLAVGNNNRGSSSCLLDLIQRPRCQPVAPSSRLRQTLKTAPLLSRQILHGVRTRLGTLQWTHWHRKQCLHRCTPGGAPLVQQSPTPPAQTVRSLLCTSHTAVNQEH